MQTSTITNRLPGHAANPLDGKAQLQQMAAAMPDGVMPDTYGEGENLQAFEASVAAMFGHEAAVFMPSGTMAQQIALRLWSERSRNSLIAMHPTSHLETAEQLGYQHLMKLQRVQFGVPEQVSHRLLTAADLESLAEVPSALLLELPARPLGGQLPDWDSLLDIRDWCYQHGVYLHLDGARVWSALTYYQAKNEKLTFADIGKLFDSVYVSFYKDLGGLCGCMLLGPEDFVSESKIWQRRFGGNLYTQLPFVASAQQGMEQRLPKMGDWVNRARQLAALMNQVEGVQTNPAEPHSNIFQLMLKGEAEALKQRHDALVEQTGTFLFGRIAPSAMPGYAVTEVHCWENAMAFDTAGLQDFLAALVSEAP